MPPPRQQVQKRKPLRWTVTCEWHMQTMSLTEAGRDSRPIELSVCIIKSLKSGLAGGGSAYLSSEPQETPHPGAFVGAAGLTLGDTKVRVRFHFNSRSIDRQNCLAPGLSVLPMSLLLPITPLCRGGWSPTSLQREPPTRLRAKWAVCLPPEHTQPSESVTEPCSLQPESICGLRTTLTSETSSNPIIKAHLKELMALAVLFHHNKFTESTDITEVVRPQTNTETLKHSHSWRTNAIC